MLVIGVIETMAFLAVGGSLSRNASWTRFAGRSPAGKRLRPSTSVVIIRAPRIDVEAGFQRHEMSVRDLELRETLALRRLREVTRICFPKPTQAVW